MFFYIRPDGGSGVGKGELAVSEGKGGGAVRGVQEERDGGER